MYSIYIGPQYILQGGYIFKVYIRYMKYILEIVRGNSEGIPLKRVSRCLKTVTNLSLNCQLLVFYMLFLGLQRRYLVKGVDCNEIS